MKHYICICWSIVIDPNVPHFSVCWRLCQLASCAMSSVDASALEFVVHGVRVKDCTGTNAAMVYVHVA